jgi:hypothetical protein
MTEATVSSSAGQAPVSAEERHFAGTIVLGHALKHIYISALSWLRSWASRRSRSWVS